MDERNVAYRYREYRKDPLDEGEIRDVLGALGVPAAAVLRRNDRAFKELALTGEEEEDVLIRLMAEHPTLLQRPIGVYQGRAAVGRPPEALLDLVGIDH